VPSEFRDFLLFLVYPVIWKEQVYWILWERLPAAIVLIRGWKPLPQMSFLVTWAYRISALVYLLNNFIASGWSHILKASI
jgi:hypothetical protein